MKNFRQGRYNSNYKQPIQTINLLHRDEMEEAMNVTEDQLRTLLEKFNSQYLNSTYPSRIDVGFMYDKIIRLRKEKQNKEQNVQVSDTTEAR